ncbi:hypothetical protein BBP40_006354 [Aspergillus hancockii]|nr:hypothetical protein BBP40_006354 [Aspergillus hancockii]
MATRKVTYCYETEAGMIEGLKQSLKAERTNIHNAINGAKQRPEFGHQVMQIHRYFNFDLPTAFSSAQIKEHIRVLDKVITQFAAMCQHVVCTSSVRNTDHCADFY